MTRSQMVEQLSTFVLQEREGVSEGCSHNKMMDKLFGLNADGSGYSAVRCTECGYISGIEWPAMPRTAPWAGQRKH